MVRTNEKCYSHGGFKKWLFSKDGMSACNNEFDE
jgi:hypothetical protein